MKNYKSCLCIIIFITLSISLFAQKSNDTNSENILKYYKNSYIEARKTFNEKTLLLQKKYPQSKIIKVNVPSKKDNDLSVDLFYIPSLKEKDKIMTVSSGVHGIEGFVGSAIQSMFLDKFVNEELLNETGILLIHSVNPYGFKYERRVTENNIDLNRNSSIDTSLYSTVNEGYTEIYDFINPQGPLNTKSCANRLFFFKAVLKILKASMPVLRQAVLQGQYQYSEGLYFGGKTYEPQITSLNPIIDSICEPYEVVFALDLHTGYGERGKLHLFPNPVEDAMRKRMETIFAGYQIDWGDSDDFYTVTGDFIGFTGKLNEDKVFIPMAFEYGTMDSQKTSGSLKSIHIMIMENQANHFGYKREKDSLKINEDIMEMYYPSSEEWRIKIMNDTEEIFKKIIPRYLKIN